MNDKALFRKISAGVLFLVVIFSASLSVSGLMMVESASAQSVSKPSVPEFTLKYADHSYDVPSTIISILNPYNNQTTVTTVPGYPVQNLTIDLTVKNQPIPSAIDGNKSYLLFYIRLKGHYSNDWTYPYTAINSYPKQSNSDYTVISFPASYSVATPYGMNTEALRAGDKIDFQVKAILAYGYLHYLGQTPEQIYDYHSVSASDWSNTQTIIIPVPQWTPSPSTSSTSDQTESAASQSPSRNSIPTQSQQSSENNAFFDLSLGEIAIIVLLSIIAVLLVVVAVSLHKKKQKANCKV